MIHKGNCVPIQRSVTNQKMYTETNNNQTVWEFVWVGENILMLTYNLLIQPGIA